STFRPRPRATTPLAADRWIPGRGSSDGTTSRAALHGGVDASSHRHTVTWLRVSSLPAETSRHMRCAQLITVSNTFSRIHLGRSEKTCLDLPIPRMSPRNSYLRACSYHPS